MNNIIIAMFITICLIGCGTGECPITSCCDGTCSSHGGVCMAESTTPPPPSNYDASIPFCSSGTVFINISPSTGECSICCGYYNCKPCE